MLSKRLGILLIGLTALMTTLAVANTQEGSAQENPAHDVAELHQGALLPSHRIVGYYGNFYSSHMGILGEYPEDQMLEMLNNEVKKWQKADPSKKVIPAIDYIAVVAQGSPMANGKYISRMPNDQIEKAIAMAKKIDGIVVLDVQVGLSNVQTEIPRLEQYLKLPNVMLALDPEFAMAPGQKPGHVIGSMDAKDINWTANYLAKIVRENHLPTKFLVVHRFTQHMVTNAKQIKPLPEVQIVMDMDGWGAQSLKRDSYEAFIVPESVQYTGFKLFYKNDKKASSSGLYTPEQIIQFKPAPLYILYQ